MWDPPWQKASTSHLQTLDLPEQPQDMLSALLLAAASSMDVFASISAIVRPMTGSPLFYPPPAAYKHTAVSRVT